ncbi:MAG: tripartite tricarboxylate transporter substrate binding protein [Rhizobiales bacterium]|nr:tripartite tricarboxylate transporter substrate binding protein [Hyphomicrobiales bacterium]
MTAFLTRRALLATALVAPAFSVRAQSFPDHPLRLVVPYSAGGGTDVVARAIGRDMEETLGQPVVIENKTGANTAIAADYVARAEPDGYTMYFAGASSLVVPPLVTPKLPIRPMDFAPVSLVLKQPYALGVNPEFADSLDTMVKKLRADPDKYSFGHTGTGGIGHLIGVRLMNATNTKMVSVTYRGFQQTVIDVITGRVAMTFEAVNNFLPFVADGRVRLLAVSSDKRVPQLPDVPTFVEAGYPDMVVESWIAVFVPKATPRPVIDRLNRAVAHAVDSEKFKDMAAKAIQRPEAGSPEDLGALLQKDIDVWRKVIAPLNLPGSN